MRTAMNAVSCPSKWDFQCLTEEPHEGPGSAERVQTLVHEVSFEYRVGGDLGHTDEILAFQIVDQRVVGSITRGWSFQAFAGQREPFA